MRRLLWIALGLGLAALTLLVLERTESGGPGSAAQVPSLTGPPLDEIDADSRRQLERALIEAERREAGAR